MIIIELTGGLGNQMFQYAAARALADRRGYELKLDIEHYRHANQPKGFEKYQRTYDLPYFKVRAPIATHEEIHSVRGRYRKNSIAKLITSQIRRRTRLAHFGHYRERSRNFEKCFPNISDQTYIEGLFQNEQYFKGDEKLIEDFEPADPADAARANQKIAELRQEGGPLVAVHVRRGDLVAAVGKIHENKPLAPLPPLPAEYFSTAIARFEPQCRFVVFSEDISWCRENIQPPHVYFVEGQTPFQDFELMRRCDHNINSNSTFGWWAAWLNRNPAKRVIAPRTWYLPEYAKDFKVELFFPATWEIL